MEDLYTRELEVLAESSRLLTSTLDLGEVLDRLAGIARRRLDVDVVRIWLLDESGEFLVLRAQQGPSRSGSPGKARLLPRQSLSGWVLTHGAPLVLADAREDPRLENRDWFDAEGLVSALAVPIQLDRNPLGVLTCMSRTRRVFTDAEVAVAQALTAPAVAAVRNAALYAEAVDRVDEIRALQRVVSETLSSPALETTLQAVVREMRTLLRCDAAVCSVLDAQTARLRTVTTSGARTDGIPGYSPGSREGGLARLVLQEKRAMRSDDYLADPRFVRTPAIETWARAEGLVALIVAPVLDASGEVIALLWAFNRTPAPFTLRHEATLSSLAQQAALAIGRARAFEEERRRAQQTAALLDIARACTSTLELGPLLKDITCRTAAALGAERCAIFLWRGGHLAPVMAQFADGHADPSLWARFKALRDYHMEEVPAHAEAMRLRRPVHVARGSTLLPPEWFDSLRIGSAVVLPLVSNDRVVGTMGLDARSTRIWHQGQVDLAMTIAAQVALAVDNARHYQDARQRAAEVETLAAIGETLTSTLHTQDVLERIADSATSLIGAQRAFVFELDREAGCLRARAIRGLTGESAFTLPIGQGAAGQAAVNLEPAWSEDVVERPLPGYAEPYGQSDTALGAVAREFGGRAILAVPVISRGAALGAISVGWDDPHRPDEREIRLLSALGRQAAIAIENARLVGDLRRTLEELRAAQETLVRGATLRAVGELAAGAAHHLNNIMAVILGRTQLLLMKNLDQATTASLKRIEHAAIDAADTVRGLKGFGGRGKAREVTRFDLNAAIQEVIEFTQPRWLGEHGVASARFEVQVELGLIPEVSGDRIEICEAIANLVLNAMDALPDGGRIVIATRAEPGRAIVSVSDAGVGMPAEVRQRAFEPFFTTKGVKRTGLGLAVAYGTVRRHGGQIAIESAPGDGTTVTFWIPEAEERAAAERAPAPAPRAGSVLVIDDEADIRDLVSDVLASHGHQVTVAAGGREGLACFEAGSYDVVLTDLGMPDLDGWEVARAIKSARSATPVLLLTGWADTTDSEAASLVDGILKKPFGLDELAEAVATTLAGRARASVTSRA
jgi:GAF domain-containing protein/ActR/RegA family two-component response regulator/anti-sigma regulatory factor (Ser/Thr protein kinase)